jgi:hypothetical protein
MVSVGEPAEGSLTHTSSIYNKNSLKTSAMDISDLVSMKNAAKCESHCEFQNTASQYVSNAPGIRKGMFALVSLLLLAVTAVLSLRVKAGVYQYGLSSQ